MLLVGSENEEDVHVLKGLRFRVPRVGPGQEISLYLKPCPNALAHLVVAPLSVFAFGLGQLEALAKGLKGVCNRGHAALQYLIDAIMSGVATAVPELRLTIPSVDRYVVDDMPGTSCRPGRVERIIL